MDSDDATVELRTAPKFKGFRQRWQSDLRSSVPETSVPSVQDVCEDPQLEPVGDLFGTDLSFQLEGVANHDGLDSVDQTEVPLADELGDSLKRSCEPDGGVPSSSTHPQVLDPFQREPEWKASAIFAEVKRTKNSHLKLPWELDGSVFQTRDLWQGQDKMFTPSSLGARDVLDSQVVQATLMWHRAVWT